MLLVPALALVLAVLVLILATTITSTNRVPGLDVGICACSHVAEVLRCTLETLLDCVN